MSNSIFKIIFGDLGGDGHNKHKTVIYEADCSFKEVKKQYSLLCEKIGFNLFFEEYDEPFLTLKQYNSLVEIMGEEYMKKKYPKGFSGIEEDKYESRWNSWDYSQLFQDVLNKLEPSFNIREALEDVIPCLDEIGYGLSDFSD